jgi:hypothetical protein
VVECRRLMDVVEPLPTQPQLMDAGPRGSTRIDDSLPQKHFRQPVADPHQIGAGIFAGPHQIAYRLNLTIGHRYRRDLTQPQQPGQMRGIAGIGFHPIPGRALQLRWCRDHTFHPGLGHCPRQPEPGRPGLVGHPYRRSQLMQPAQNFPVVRAQPCPSDLACLLVNGVRHHRKRVHVQPDTRTLNNHRRPPDAKISPASVINWRGSG